MAPYMQRTEVLHDILIERSCPQQRHRRESLATFSILYDGIGDEGAATDSIAFSLYFKRNQQRILHESVGSVACFSQRSRNFPVSLALDHCDNLWSTDFHLDDWFKT
jgi:hypothetical protein